MADRSLEGIELFEQAYDLALQAHDGQLYQGRMPYIKHPAGVAGLARAQGYDLATQAGCLLHDVVEKTPYGLEDLLDAGIPEFVVDAVAAVTHHDGEDKLAKSRSHPLGYVIRFYDANFNLQAFRQADRDGTNPDIVHKCASLTQLLVALEPDLPTPQSIKELSRSHTSRLIRL